MEIVNTILQQYGFDINNIKIEIFGNGLINSTWKVNLRQSNEAFILQKINENIFKHPENIAFNIRLIANDLKRNHPNYLFVAPLLDLQNKDIVKTEAGSFRLFSFVSQSHTVDVLQNSNQAFQAAKQFGRFTRYLSDFDAETLKTTIPDFHNLTLRFDQFQSALKIENNDRRQLAKNSIEFLQANQNIVDTFHELLNSNILKRVIHHDTKISNVLFDGDDLGLCVIDLDTVMPGYYISDVGDMMRTYLSPVSEEEKDFSKIEIRVEFFEAIVNGYLSEMKAVLNENELKYFVFAGKFMIYMQALRFLTDYLQNDIYYGAKYPDQNLVRAQNQNQLLSIYLSLEPEFNKILQKYI
jgi:Ser/Thr protein kinase RdoA (MazF antagonist)